MANNFMNQTYKHFVNLNLQYPDLKEKDFKYFPVYYPICFISVTMKQELIEKLDNVERNILKFLQKNNNDKLVASSLCIDKKQVFAKIELLKEGALLDENCNVTSLGTESLIKNQKIIKNEVTKIFQLDGANGQLIPLNKKIRDEEFISINSENVVTCIKDVDTELIDSLLIGNVSENIYLDNKDALEHKITEVVDYQYLYTNYVAMDVMIYNKKYFFFKQTSTNKVIKFDIINSDDNVIIKCDQKFYQRLVNETKLFYNNEEVRMLDISIGNDETCIKVECDQKIFNNKEIELRLDNSNLDLFYPYDNNVVTLDFMEENYYPNLNLNRLLNEKVLITAPTKEVFEELTPCFKLVDNELNIDAKLLDSYNEYYSKDILLSVVTHVLLYPNTNYYLSLESPFRCKFITKINSNVESNLINTIKLYFKNYLIKNQDRLVTPVKETFTTYLNVNQNIIVESYTNLKKIFNSSKDFQKMYKDIQNEYDTLCIDNQEFVEKLN